MEADEKNFNAKTDLWFASSLIGRLPDHETKEWIQTTDKIKELRKTLHGKTMDRVQYTYLAEHPKLVGLINMYEKDVNGTLKDLQEQANAIRNNPDYTPKTREDLLSLNSYKQRMLKKAFVFKYKQYSGELED